MCYSDPNSDPILSCFVNISVVFCVSIHAKSSMHGVGRNYLPYFTNITCIFFIFLRHRELVEYLIPVPKDLNIQYLKHHFMTQDAGIFVLPLNTSLAQIKT